MQAQRLLACACINHHKPSPASWRSPYKQARNHDRRIPQFPSLNHRSNIRLHAGAAAGAAAAGRHIIKHSSNHQSNLRMFAGAAPAGRRIIKHHKPSPASWRSPYKQARNHDRRIPQFPSLNHRSNIRLHAGTAAAD